MGHPIHKHMSSGQRYDDKQAYNKDLPASERLHYLENEEHDKGMSRHSSPANNVSYGDKSGVTGYIGEQRADLMKYNPVDDKAGMSRYGSDYGDSPAKGLKERVVRRQDKVDASRASFGTDDVDGGFDRKLNRLKKSVAKSEKRGMNMDYDTTDASGEGRSRTSTRSGVSRHTSEHSTEEYMARKDAAIKGSKGVSRYSNYDDAPTDNLIDAAKSMAGGAGKVAKKVAKGAKKLAGSRVGKAAIGAAKNAVLGLAGGTAMTMGKAAMKAAGVSRQKYGGNKGDESRSKRDY